ncbi:anhydro-N-acetylmuramic acid kinase [Sharpea azabuensis]|uniref:anhydro-N-acetylmuramic acid kinase n=1 Tax=Sharpea azabuensis TaxID=322505 RepID=UPI0023F41C6F|nr:anhydro-N-acetylmuramic acid kinase [Sharpea azabuensis]
MKAIGLMSGTSLDGLDIAYCDIQGNYTDTKVKLLDYREVKMPHHLKEKIQYCCQTDGGHVQDICSLNFELGSWFGQCTKIFMDWADYLSYS